MEKDEIKKKYVTVEDGMDFRKISDIMCRAGFEMNHATARNVLVSGLTKFVSNISENLKSGITESKIEELLKNQDTHDSFADILYLANQELIKKKANNNEV